MEREAVKVRGFTAKSLAVSLGLSIAVLLFTKFARSAGDMDGWFYTAYDWKWQGSMFPMFLGYVLVLLVVSSALRIKWNMAELSFVYCLFFMVINMNSTSFMHDFRIILAIASSLTNPTYRGDTIKYIPTLLGSGLSTEATAPLMSGHHPTGFYPVPWGEWATPIAYISLLALSLNFSLLFGSRILARVWIGVEDLPYPLETSVLQMFSWTAIDGENKRSRLFKQKWMWIGVLIGFLGTFIESINQVYWPPSVPWLPTGYSPWELIISTKALVPFMTHATFYPWALGLGLIVPMSVSVSVPLFWVIFNIILWTILAYLGIMRNPMVSPTGETPWMNWENAHTAANKLWQRGYIPIFVGIGFAIAIVPLIVNWKTVKASLSSKEDRMYWIGWLVCGILFLGLLMAVNIPVHWALLMIIFTGLEYLMLARMLGETGGMVGVIRRGIFIAEGGGQFEYTSILKTIGTQGNPTATYPTILISNYYQSGAEFNMAGGYYHHALYPAMSGLKMKQLTKADEKETMIAQIIAMPIAVVLGGVWMIFTAYYRSGGWYPVTWSTKAYNLSLRPTPIVMNEAWLGPMDTNTVIVYIVGFALGAFLYLARFRFGGIMTYISPSAVFLVALSGFHLWVPFLAATIIKMIVSKVGGQPMIAGKIYPLGVGLVAGLGLAFVSASITMGLRDTALLGLRWWP